MVRANCPNGNQSMASPQKSVLSKLYIFANFTLLSNFTMFANFTFFANFIVMLCLVVSLDLRDKRHNKTRHNNSPQPKLTSTIG